MWNKESCGLLISNDIEMQMMTMILLIYCSDHDNQHDDNSIQYTMMIKITHIMMAMSMTMTKSEGVCAVNAFAYKINLL